MLDPFQTVGMPLIETVRLRIMSDVLIEVVEKERFQKEYDPFWT
jgi:hypothetical protein